MRPTTFNQLKDIFMILLYFFVAYCIYDILTRIIQTNGQVEISFNSEWFNLSVGMNTNDTETKED